jgi:hypothetical protein
LDFHCLAPHAFGQARPPNSRLERRRAVIAPSGDQITIAAGDQQAVVVEVGGGLRSYSAGGRELVDGHRHVVEKECKNFYASNIFYPTATASRHTFIAVARKARCVLAEIRWRWTLKVLYAAAYVERNLWAEPGLLKPCIFHSRRRVD